ncbi:MAG TPA: GNAT family N-acetyltransferase [Streptosporangiaceae bacterium]|nr:GNAT family N-acetyltransferase [Streptosporangiaceae bacterium]
MPAPEIALRLLSGAEAAGSGDDVAALRAEVCGAPPHRPGRGAGPDGPDGPDGGFGRRFGRQRRQPGFVLAEARHGGYLVGYAFGVPLRPATSWWRDLTAPLPEDLTAEHPGRTFALAELTVRAAWRRQGVGRDLHDLILDGRAEDRATAAIPVAAAPAQGAYQRWGWRKAARKHPEPPADGLLDVLLLDLAAGT